jgi:hypothetical protein
VAAVVLGTTAVAALATAVGLTAAAAALRANLPAGASQQDVDARNQSLRAYGIAAPTLYAVGGAAAVSSLVLWFWRDLPASVAPLQRGAVLTVSRSWP